MGPEGNQQIFPGATNTTIHGGIFPAVHGDMHIHSPGPKRYVSSTITDVLTLGLELLLSNITQSAFHNAAERGDPPRCYRHTRIAILKEIMTWISAPTAHRRFILWLYGPAGAGKTAIAQTIAEACEKAGLLAASFFFGRTAAGRNNSSRFIATLAYQLSLSIPEICEPMFAVIEKDPTIFSRALSVQMQTLIVAPLASFTGPIRQGPQVVVVDGVDEGGPDGKMQAELLNVLGAAVSELRHIPIIFLIGSRPEYDIRLAFNTNPLISLMKSLVLDDKYKPDADIKHYLKSEFEEIRDKQLALGTPLPSSWPTENDVDRLVKKSSGQFIFASTVIKFVDSPRRDPVKCLDIILGLSDPGKETPFAQLDALYHFILSSVDDCQKVLEVLTLLMLAGDYSNELRVGVVDALLGYEVRRVLVDMHALVFVPNPTDSRAVLRTYHASLYDFLMDRSRSQDFFVDAKQGHIASGQRWLRMITNYSHSKRSKECSLSLQVKALVGHCNKLPDGGLAGCLANFDLKALLEKIVNGKDLYGPEWDKFMTACQKQQANNTRVEFFPEFRKEFDNFILVRFSQYHPSIQSCIPALFVKPVGNHIKEQDIQNIFLVLLHGACQTEAEFAQIKELDGRSLNIRNWHYNRYFAVFFQNRMNIEQYADRSSHVVLIKELVKVIRPKPSDSKLHIAVEDVEILLPERYLGYSFRDLLSESPKDLDLAHLLRERALQYRGTCSETLHNHRRDIAIASLEYVQKCHIPHLRHAHPPDPYGCIICEFVPTLAFVCNDMEDIPPTSEYVSGYDSPPYPSPAPKSSRSTDVAVSLTGDRVNRKRLATDSSIDTADASVEAKSPPRKRQKMNQASSIRAAPA